jgi:hypothetical protein
MSKSRFTLVRPATEGSVKIWKTAPVSPSTGMPPTCTGLLSAVIFEAPGPENDSVTETSVSASPDRLLNPTV